jgi:hypothetical protein
MARRRRRCRQAVFMVLAIGDVRMPAVPFVRSLSASLPVREWRAGWSGRCPARCDRAWAVRKAVRWWRPSWMPDTTERISDGDRLADASASSMGAGGYDGRVPLPVVAGVDRRNMRITVLSGQPRTCRPRGLPWPAGRAHGRTLGAGGVRRLAVAVRTGTRPIGWAVTSNWGCPADRTVKRSAMSVARPATARVSAGGTDRRRWCQPGVRRRHPGGSGRPAGLRACPASHGRGPRGAHRGDPGLGARVDERLRRGSLLSATDRVDGGVWGRVGQRVLVSGSRPSALAGRAGALLDGGSSPGTADRLAAGESVGRSCR